MINIKNYVFKFLDLLIFFQGLIFISIIILFLITFAYIKIRFPFWHRQPVFHKYDFWRYLIKKPFIIQNNTVISNKFFDNENIKTFQYNSFQEEQIDKFVNFIQLNYIKSENVLFVANKKTLNCYITGQNNPSFISFYQEGYLKGCI